MENLIKETREIVCRHNYSKEVVDELVCLVECLGEMLYKVNPSGVQSAFDDFFNFETLNYLSDAELGKISLTKWNKQTILNWLNENELPTEEIGIYNANALIYGMNKEFSTHGDYIEKQADPPMVAYELAVTALHHPNYV